MYNPKDPDHRQSMVYYFRRLLQQGWWVSWSGGVTFQKRYRPTCGGALYLKIVLPTNTDITPWKDKTPPTYEYGEWKQRHKRVEHETLKRCQILATKYPEILVEMKFWNEGALLYKVRIHGRHGDVFKNVMAVLDKMYERYPLWKHERRYSKSPRNQRIYELRKAQRQRVQPLDLVEGRD